MSTIRAETETTRLGRYRVVKRLAAGGMADVLLARTEGIEGFERHIVIKRIHAELLEEPRYIKMFLDEARLAASLHHTNIVQVNDIGEEGGEYFFAMEYVHGEDARNLLVQAVDRGATIPIEHVITIITGAAAGLHHAHEQLGPDRAPLEIVHRDVSPANILVGFDGSVKVADFGIALASHRAEQTQSGVLKGKVAYMSPEQCNCERVDRRSDVFSLGICLYELATVHPCFHGGNDFMTMSAIVGGTFTRPSQLNAAITPALETIILKALAKDPADRYQTADELRQALEHYATYAGLRSSTTALADYMKEQFGTRAMPWHDSADDDLEIPVEPSVVKVLADPIPDPPSRPVKPTLPLRALRPPTPLPTPVSAADLEPEIVMELTRIEPPEPELAAPVIASESNRKWWLLCSVLAVIAAALALVLVIVDKPTAKPAAATKPTRPSITPLPAPTVETPSAAQAPPIEAAPAKPAAAPAKPMPAKRKAGTKGKAPTKWNPDALFPQ